MAEFQLDSKTGLLVVADLGAFDPAVSRTSFLSTGPGRHVAPPPEASGVWTVCALTCPRPDGLLWKLRVAFEGERLHSATLALVSPHTPASWDTWTANSELDRQAKHDAWLASMLGPAPYRYAWGSVGSVFDERAAASYISIVYTR